MQYDFNTKVDRSKNFSAKYDELKKAFGRDDIIPLWIADMDLPTAQPIMDAIEQRNKQGIFGYTSRPESTFVPSAIGRKSATAGTLIPAL